LTPLTRKSDTLAVIAETDHYILQSNRPDHVYQIRGFEYVRTQYAGDDVYFHIRHADSHIRCPECHTASVRKNGTRKRTYRLPPSGHRRLHVTLLVQRIRCRECVFDGQLPVPFAKPGVSYSKGFERYALELLLSAPPIMSPSISAWAGT
jgi:transposase